MSQFQNNENKFSSILFIDVRNYDEVARKRFDNNIHNVINIPANMIKFNLKSLRDIVISNKYKNIYVICRNNNSAKIVYDKYFANDDILSQIKNYNYLTINDAHDGKALHFEFDELFILGELKFIYNKETIPFNMIQIVQMLLSSIILFSGIFILYSCPKFKPLKYFMIIIGLVTLFSSFTRTYVLSEIFGNKDI